MPVRFACAALLAFALADIARADVIRFTDQASGPSGGLLLLSLPQFDPALGTLTAARWELSSSVRGRFVFDSELTTPFSRRVDVGAFIGAGVTPGGFSITLDAGQLVSFNLAADDEPGLPPDFAGRDSLSRLIIGGNIDDFNLPSTLFPVYTGDGTVFASARSRTIGIPPGNGVEVLAQEPFAVTFGATLTYEFTPVPEPSTFALVGLALLAGAGLQRRCRWRAAVRGHRGGRG